MADPSPPDACERLKAELANASEREAHIVAKIDKALESLRRTQENLESDQDTQITNANALIRDLKIGLYEARALMQNIEKEKPQIQEAIRVRSEALQKKRADAKKRIRLISSLIACQPSCVGDLDADLEQLELKRPSTPTKAQSKNVSGLPTSSSGDKARKGNESSSRSDDIVLYCDWDSPGESLVHLKGEAARRACRI